MKVEQADLAAVGDAAFKLHQRLSADGDHAKAGMQEAGTAMRQDFALGPALTQARHGRRRLEDHDEEAVGAFRAAFAQAVSCGMP